MRVAILVFDRCLSMEACTISDLLLMANRVALAGSSHAEAPFRVEMVSVGRRRITAAGGVELKASPATPEIDLLIVPGVDFARLEVRQGDIAVFDQEIRFIRRCFAAGVPVASVCAGAFLLAEAGLLHGRRATTAWLFAPQLARLYPDVRVDSEALMVEDGGVTTAGAFSAAADLAVHLVRRRGGAPLARRVAGLALLAPSRESQAPYVEAPLVREREVRFSARVEQWLIQRYDEPYDLQRLAAAFHCSTRTLLRRFNREVGTTPLACLQRHRVEVAKGLLRSSSLTVAEITERVGYRDVATFCALFGRLVRLSPAAYRRQFAGDGPGDTRGGK
ncbi:GlxA family transcriptional regulator [Bisbaumannia pacifica]|uniref:Helix-turn-helix domain-containing protein n=1 Tax=Bisbaumannia pacifica TaxID=77098 RepID=A0ABD4L6M3_9GAMM|nr:helix-turn-helix domain-containing protein [Halomonas pacifica]MBH8581656.1 helix-turn-helix domain-containing protein [Halomonas pacifica]